MAKIVRQTKPYPRSIELRWHHFDCESARNRSFVSDLQHLVERATRRHQLEVHYVGGHGKDSAAFLGEETDVPEGREDILEAVKCWNKINGLYFSEYAGIRGFSS
jgi:hypothetical protein